MSGETDAEMARRLHAEEMAAARSHPGAMRVPPGAVAVAVAGPGHGASALPVATLAYPVQTGVPVSGTATAATATAPGATGANFGVPTIATVPGQPVYVVDPRHMQGQAMGGIPGYPPMALVDAGTPETARLMALFHLARSVRIFACIDTFFIFIWGLYLVYLLPAIALPVCGYYGAKNFTTGPTAAYLVYICLHILGRCAWVLMADNLPAWSLLVNVMGVMIECWILRIVWTFYQGLRNSTPRELSNLRDAATATRW